jgi:hypothetical protein
MNWKELISSKTFWTGLASVASGITMITQGDSTQGIQLVFTGLGLVFLRDSIASK